MRFTSSNRLNKRLLEVGAALLLQAALLSMLVLAVPDGACAGDAVEFKHKFSPGVLTVRGDWTASLDYDLGLSAQLWSQAERESFRKSLSAHLNTKGTVAMDADLNTAPLSAAAGLTTSINLYRPPRVVLGERPGEYLTESEGFNYGRLDFSLLGGYETDQRLDNRNVTGGAELGYVLTENRGFKALVPSVFVGYDFIHVDRSELQRHLGVDDDDFRRWRVFASWKIPVGEWLSERLDPLNAHVDLRYYRSDGVPGAIREAGKDDAFYAAGGLSYSFGPQPLWRFVNAVFVRVADGRIPPVAHEATTVTVGLAMWER
jgi:hypothetical protein